MVWEKWEAKNIGKGTIAEGTALSKSKVIVCIGHDICFDVAAAWSS